MAEEPQDEQTKRYTIAIPADTTGPRALAVSLPNGGVARIEAGGEGVVTDLTEAQASNYRRSDLSVTEAAALPLAQPAAPKATRKPTQTPDEEDAA